MHTQYYNLITSNFKISLDYHGEDKMNLSRLISGPDVQETCISYMSETRTCHLRDDKMVIHIGQSTFQMFCTSSGNLIEF